MSARVVVKGLRTASVGALPLAKGRLGAGTRAKTHIGTITGFHFSCGACSAPGSTPRVRCSARDEAQPLEVPSQIQRLSANQQAADARLLALEQLVGSVVSAAQAADGSPSNPARPDLKLAQLQGELEALRQVARAGAKKGLRLQTELEGLRRELAERDRRIAQLEARLEAEQRQREMSEGSLSKLLLGRDSRIAQLEARLEAESVHHQETTARVQALLANCDKLINMQQPASELLKATKPSSSATGSVATAMAAPAAGEDQVISWTRAIRSGDVADIDALIRKGASFGVVLNKDGDQPLHLAASLSKAEMCEIILRNYVSADVRNAVGRTPLHTAAQFGSSKVVKTLLNGHAARDVKDKNGDRPLHLAARRGSLSVVKLLLDNGANPSLMNKAGKTALDVAPPGKARDLLAAAASQ